MGLADQAKNSAASGNIGGSRVRYPEPIEGRVVHIDADFMAYQVSAETKDELDPEHPAKRKSLEDMENNIHAACEHIMRLASATSYHVHTTPSGSDKGGRPAMAVQKEYQANRKDRSEKPEHLDYIRAYIVREVGPLGKSTAHLDQEADDGMAQAAYAAEEAGTPELCVVYSKDKDLRMVPGFQLIDDKVTTFEGTFGDIWVDRSKSTATCKGRGTKFFWAQCLMGDTADNIGGLPFILGKYVMGIKPTKKYIAAIKHQDDGTPAQAERAEVTIQAALKQQKPCGQVMAHDLLEHVTSDKEAFLLIREMWRDAEAAGHEFTHWETGKKVTATQALLGDMLTLWMRRNKNPRDVVDWLKEVMNA